MNRGLRKARSMFRDVSHLSLQIPDRAAGGVACTAQVANFAFRAIGLGPVAGR